MSTHNDDLVSLLAPLTARQHGLFTRDQLRGLGIADRFIERRVTGGVWVAVDHAVYRFAVTPTTWHQRVLAACLAGPAVGSHRTASALLGVPGFASTAVEVTALRHRRRKASDVVWHESLHLDPIDVGERAGIPITSPARTFVDLGAVLSEPGLVAVYDDLVRRRLTTRLDVVEVLDRLGARRHGTKRVRAVLDRRPRQDTTPESVLESEFDELLRRFGLPEPVRQHEVYDGDQFVARLDFALVPPKLDMEVDGAEWHRSAEAQARDRQRDEWLRRLGWIVLRFTAWDIRFRPEWVAAEIREALRARGALVA